MDFKKTMDKAIKACDANSKKGEMGGIKYEIIQNPDGSFDITMNGQPNKKNVKFGSFERAEQNVKMNIGEILSYERQTGKKAVIRKFS